MQNRPELKQPLVNLRHASKLSQDSLHRDSVGVNVRMTVEIEGCEKV
jgi:hypothetical protein